MREVTGGIEMGGWGDEMKRGDERREIKGRGEGNKGQDKS